MMKSLHIEAAKCTGCLQCEMACSFDNYGVFNPAKSRIKVFEFHETGLKVPYTCTQCSDAWCLKACPVDAITKDMHTGAMIVNGQNYNGTMIPMNYLADEQIANALTYVRNSFGNSGDAVKVEEVAKLRKELAPPAAGPSKYE